MVRLSDLPSYEAEHLRNKRCAPLGPPVWVAAPTLAEAKVALITTAGLHPRDDRSFTMTDASYRVLPSDKGADDWVMTHTSVNFDRSGFQDDINVVLPIERLRELVTDGVVGAEATYHYSFMGAGLEPAAYEKTAIEVAEFLRRDHVNLAFLTPV
ncbi:MAG: glycine/sarcosine/betaine reductase selenoprotein B family protein [Pseudomonadota bacterium]